MKQLILILLLFPIVAFSQEQKQVTITKYTAVYLKTKSWPHARDWMLAVVLSTGDTVNARAKLKLGRGTLPNGDFNYIATASNTMEAKLKRTTKMNFIKLEMIEWKGNKKYG